MNDQLQRLENWLEANPEVNWCEVEMLKSGRWCVRLIQTCERTPEEPLGERCIADAESMTLAGAVDGALLLAQEFADSM